MAEITITNGGFEEGDFSGWEVLQGNASQINVVPDDRAPYEGTYGLAVRANGEIVIRSTEFYPIPTEGSLLSAEVMLMPTRGSDRGTVRVWWFDENDAPVSPAFTENAHNTPGHVSGTGGYRKSLLNNAAIPAGATQFKIGAYIRKYTESAFSVDSFKARDNVEATIELVSPEDGAVFQVGSTVQLSAAVNIFAAGSPPGSGGGGDGSWAPPKGDTDGGGGPDWQEK